MLFFHHPSGGEEGQGVARFGQDFLKKPSSAHFSTTHLAADLPGLSVRGGAVTVSAQAIKFILQISSTAVLARALTPSDFGLVAMATTVTGFVGMFKDAGLSVATIQRAEITHGQISTLFWINTCLSTGAAMIVVCLAPLLAWVYREPRLTAVTIAIAGTFIFSGLTIQHQALLIRQMRFRAIATIEIASLALGIVIAIFLSFMNCGYWSLVGMTATTSVTNCIMTFVLSGWCPGLPVRGSGLNAMLRFGGALTGFSILNYFTRNSDSFIIGFTLGSRPLGLYSKAYSLLLAPIQQINGPIGSVMMPTLSRLQNDSGRYRRAYLKAISVLAFIGMPLVAFLFVMADETVTVLLGPGWHGAGTIFRLLAPAAFLGTVNVAPGWLCTSLGRGTVQLKWALFAAPVTVLMLLLGSRSGITGVAAAFSMSWCCMFIVFLIMACHRSPVSVYDTTLHLITPAVASISAGALTWVVKTTVGVPPFSVIWMLILCGGAFAFAYLGFSFVFERGRICMRFLFFDTFKLLATRIR